MAITDRDRRRLEGDARWHRQASESCVQRLDEMTPEMRSAYGPAYLRRLQADADTHRELADELDAYLTARGAGPAAEGPAAGDDALF